MKIALVKDTHPQLAKEWLPERNVDLRFEALRANSTTKVWWRCQKDHRHEWEAAIRRRAIEGNGCPFCSRLKVLPEESFAALYPKILTEWHPKKNSTLDPWNVAPHSNKRVWWQCRTSHHHEWQASITSRVRYGSGCRQCNRLRKPLSTEFPEVAREWHPTKNGKLTPEMIAAASRDRVWWRCSADGSHEWQASVDARARLKSKCPQCQRDAPARSSEPTLEVFDPSLAAQLHPIKNGIFAADNLTAGSTRKVFWVCPVDSTHEWEASVRNRAKLRNGCPFCAKRSRFATKGKSLEDLFPHLAAEWHPTRNGNLKPRDLLPGSSRRVWWQCQGNSEHEWESSVTTRTQKKSRGLCPFCSGHFVTDVNSLKTHHPELAAQWHATKNLPLTPSDVSRASAKRVWWQCPVDNSHEWEAKIKNRSILGSGCPHCDIENRGSRLRDSLLESANANADPFRTFRENLEGLRALIKTAPSPSRLKQMFFRMLFSSAVTIMETYLSDAFYQSVIHDDQRIEKLIQSAPEFRDRKYSLLDVLAWDRNVQQKVSEYLFELVWHNLAKVQNLYAAVLGISLPQDTQVYQAISIRHDLVHRNGRTKDGSLRSFSEKDIRAIFAMIETFIAAVDLQVKQIARVPPSAQSVASKP